jgi:hypothetical protein
MIAESTIVWMDSVRALVSALGSGMKLTFPERQVPERKVPERKVPERKYLPRKGVPSPKGSSFPERKYLPRKD